MARAIKFTKPFGGFKKGQTWPACSSQLAQKLVYTRKIAEFTEEKAGDLGTNKTLKQADTEAAKIIAEANKAAEGIIKAAEEKASETIKAAEELAKGGSDLS